MFKKIVKGSTAQTFLIVMWDNLLLLLNKGLLFFRLPRGEFCQKQGCH